MDVEPHRIPDLSTMRRGIEDDVVMDAENWRDLLHGRKVDPRIVDLVVQVSKCRSVEPPTVDTKQLLVAVEQDGYAAGRVSGSAMSFFFDPDQARRLGERHGLAVGPRSAATWIVRMPADDLSDPARSELFLELLNAALDRVAPLGSWNRGLPDARKVHGDVCQIHYVQRSLTGECPMCE